MPQMEVSDLHQKAVYWAASGVEDKYGEPEVTASNIEIDVRWEIKRGEFNGPRNNVVAFDEIAYVDRTIVIGSILRLGALLDLPDDLDNLRKVVDYSEIPDVKNRISRRFVRLIKRSDKLPSTG